MSKDHERVSAMRIGASAPVGLLREAYNSALDRWRKLAAKDRKSAAETAALEVGRQLLPGCEDAKIIAIASGAATLRGWSDTGITYHDKKCKACRGTGNPCARRRDNCRGDGFDPPQTGEDHR